MAKSGIPLADIDLVEINEAFASVPMAWLAETGYPHEQTNVNGGAIALGHPLGATGTKLMTTCYTKWSVVRCATAYKLCARVAARPTSLFWNGCEGCVVTGLCKGRVVIVTGAGGGLGAAHAKSLAAEGAAVLVNDINQAAAQAVVDEIVSAGGEAVVNQSDITNYDSSGEAIQQALSVYGNLHAVVNNAGNNRDRMFASLSEADWDAVMAVHLKGHFCLASHAVQYWRHQAKAGETVSGRLVNTT